MVDGISCVLLCQASKSVRKRNDLYYVKSVWSSEKEENGIFTKEKKKKTLSLHFSRTVLLPKDKLVRNGYF